MENIKFYFALLSSKICLSLFKITGNRQDDRPGSLALRLYPNFLERVTKPKTVICVTGTNGKTTVSNLISTSLIKLGNKVAYNDWGANTKIGVARCLLDSVSIFNRPKKDICILETDELTSKDIWPYIKPNYIIVTNLSRDSMHRNAHPQYIFNEMNKGIIPSSALILNADDPISSFLGTNQNKKVYFGIDKLSTDHKKPYNSINDMAKLNYEFVRYNNISRVKCPNCDFESLKPDYLITKIDNEAKKIYLNHDKKEIAMPLINDSIFNIYNILSVITCLSTMGYTDENIIYALKNTEIVKSRYSSTTVNNITVSTIATKGLNAVATSTVCDYIANEKGNIELIMVLDDTFDNIDGSEAIAWIYDSDFEFINKDNIKKIIIGGVRNRDYRLRLLLAGIDDKKIVCTQNEMDTYKYIDTKNIDAIYIMHEVYFIKKSQQLKDLVINKILKEGNDK